MVTAIIMCGRDAAGEGYCQGRTVSFSFTNYNTEKGSTHKQHVTLFEHIEITAAAELPDHSDPDTCHIYKGLDMSYEQFTPEFKPVG